MTKEQFEIEAQKFADELVHKAKMLSLEKKQPIDMALISVMISEIAVFKTLIKSWKESTNETTRHN